MAIGKCLKCDSIGEMTEDHVIPKWFRKQLPNFGIKIPPQHEIQIVCKKCNGEKGGKIDFSHETSRSFMKEIVNNWIREIRKYETYTP